MSRPAVAWAAVAMTLAADVIRNVALPGASADALLSLLMSMAFAVLGAVIVTRSEVAVIGWVMIVAGVGTASYDAMSAVAYRGLVATPAPQAGAVWAAWVGSWIWIPGFSAAFIVLPLLFPDGCLPSPRWRPIWGVIAVMLAAQLVVEMLRPGPMTVTDPASDIDIAVAANPLGLEALAPVLVAYDVVINLGFFPLLAALVVGVAVRYRRADVVVRYQLRWFLFAVAILPVAFVVSAVGAANAVAQAVAGALLAGIPISIALAVLRYRLYEIDRIISRTVTYALVTAVLATVYIAVAVLPSTVVGLESDLLVAAATLAVAAAFVPVRRSVQAVVDRRFNRARYDAARVVRRFGAQLRHDIDLDSLIGDLRGVVASTVQPAHLSLWLARREGPR